MHYPPLCRNSFVSFWFASLQFRRSRTIVHQAQHPHRFLRSYAQVREVFTISRSQPVKRLKLRTHWSNGSMAPASVLAAVATGRQHPQLRDACGRPYYDRCPETFQIIVDHIRGYGTQEPLEIAEDFINNPLEIHSGVVWGP